MKILFLNYEYPPLGGGAANANHYIFQEFSKIPDLEVELVTSSIDKNYIEERVGKNIIIHRLPIGKNPKNLHYQSIKELLVYSWKAYQFSVQLTRDKKFDLVHAFFTLPGGLIAYLIKRKFNLPYIVSLRGSDVPGYSERFSFIYKIFTPLFTFIWKKSSATVANSQGLKELALLSNPKQEISVIYNGIDINRFQPNEEDKPKNEFIIMPGASRITQRKGLKYLIQAFQKVASRHPRLRLEIMGEGDEKNNLEKQVKEANLSDKISFLGRIPQEKVAKYYQRASLFVLPSLNEGMSNAMLEALASGLPLIATDTGGSKELITEKENGFIVKMKSAEDIAAKIELLFNDPELRKKMAENSRQKALKMSWQKVAESYYNLYKTL